ncbi:uncharacterized protein LOC119742709 [Patiria miniata]|uniref:Uncharacterized protein n=1 Tax=Patiria miniata TaxID=46514 RepID=A0A914BG07_PATMI|nr:uncharacterized protein LOC119742709 [Patiria miniata]
MSWRCSSICYHQCALHQHQCACQYSTLFRSHQAEIDIFSQSYHQCALHQYQCACQYSTLFWDANSVAHEMKLCQPICFHTVGNILPSHISSYTELLGDSTISASIKNPN